MSPGVCDVAFQSDISRKRLGLLGEEGGTLCQREKKNRLMGHGWRLPRSGVTASIFPPSLLNMIPDAQHSPVADMADVPVVRVESVNGFHACVVVFLEHGYSG